MSPPRLSIVIPTRDTMELTLACLESLREHGVPGTEVVVVDDAGTDGTDEAVRHRFPSVRVIRNAEPAGFTASANRGLTATRGRMVLLLNSDTEVLPETLPALLETFENEPRLGVAGALLSYLDGAEQWSGGAEPGRLWLFLQASGLGRFVGKLWFRRRPSRRVAPDESAKALRPVDWVTGAALTVRREVLEEVGRLDERFSFYAQDLDFCQRVGDAGWLVAVVPACPIVHHHGSSIARGGRTVGAQQLDMLWSDLLLWAEKRHGVAGRRAARIALTCGASLRFCSRLLASPVMLPVRGRDWLRELGASRRGLVSLLTP